MWLSGPSIGSWIVGWGSSLSHVSIQYARLMRPYKVETCHVALVLSNFCSEELSELVCECKEWVLLIHIYIQRVRNKKEHSLSKSVSIKQKKIRKTIYRFSPTRLIHSYNAHFRDNGTRARNGSCSIRHDDGMQRTTKHYNPKKRNCNVTGSSQEDWSWFWKISKFHTNI